MIPLERHSTADWPEDSRLLAEHVRLQTAMIELLNEQLRKHRRSEEEQAEEIRSLKRVLRLRDDLLHLRAQEVEYLKAALPTVRHFLVRRLRRLRQALQR